MPVLQGSTRPRPGCPWPNRPRGERLVPKAQQLAVTVRLTNFVALEVIAVAEWGSVSGECARIAADADVLRRPLGGTRGTLARMTSEHPTYPERTTDDERRNALLQMQIYLALGMAANDAHAVLDSVLSASDPDAARRALEDRYEFTERQAQAVMDLPFGRLTSTDRQVTSPAVV